MASVQYQDKNSGKTLRGEKYSDFITSASAGSSTNPKAAQTTTIDGKKHDVFKGNAAIEILPYRVKRGDQAKFFPGLSSGSSTGLIDTASGVIRDTVDGVVYIPITKKNYLKNMVGVGSAASKSFGAQAYAQISASLVNLYAGTSDGTQFVYAVEEFYSSPSASKANAIVGPVTASIKLFASGGVGTGLQGGLNGVRSQSYSAIDNLTGSVTPAHADFRGRPDFEMNFDGDFATHWDIRFQNGALGAGITPAYSSSAWIPTVFHRFQGKNTSTATASFVLNHFGGIGGFGEPLEGISSSPFAQHVSGTIINSGQVHFINGLNGLDGTVTRHLFKARIAGDGDSGSFYSFPGNTEVAIYSNDAVNAMTGSFYKFATASAQAATGSSDIREIFHYSGSGNNSGSVGYNNIFLPADASKGSLLHKDINGRFNVDVGFYSPLHGTHTTGAFFAQTASDATNSGPTYAYITQIT